jgi:hypothetical protein
MRTPLLVLSIALIACGVSSVWLWSELRTERAVNAELTARLASQQPATAPAPTSAPTTLVVDTSAGANSPTPAGTATAAATAEESAHAFLAEERRLLKDKNYYEAQRDVRRAQLSDWRDDAISLLGFTRAEADAVVDAVVERQMLGRTQGAQATEASPEGIQRAREAMEASERVHQDQIRALVGEDKRARWENYLEPRFTRRQVDSFRARLTGADVLRDEQVEPLITALHAETAEYEREVRELVESLADTADGSGQQQKHLERRQQMLEAVNDRKRAAAANILSASQLRHLEALLQKDLDRELARQRAALVESSLQAAQERPN